MFVQCATIFVPETFMERDSSLALIIETMLNRLNAIEQNKQKKDHGKITGGDNKSITTVSLLLFD